MKKPQRLIKRIPPALAEAIEADAREHNWNRNDTVCRILSRRFKVPFEPTGYPYRATKGLASEINLRMSPELYEALAVESRKRGLPARGLIVSTLQIHYDLPTDSPRRQTHYPSLSEDMLREARARYEAGESLRSLSRRYAVNRETLTKALRAAA